MRLLRDALEITVSILMALSVYGIPLALVMYDAIRPPDPVALAIDAEWEGVYREVNLVEAGLLDASLPDEPETVLETATAEAVAEPAAEAAPPPAPQPPPPIVPDPVVEAAAAPPAAVPDPAPDRRSAAELRTARVLAMAGKQKKGSGGKSGGKKKCADPTPGIVQVSEREFSLERDLVLDLASDLDRAAKLASVAWWKNEKGKVDGFSVRRIRCGSVLDQAGIKNGDVIHAVNGKPVRSVIQAFGAWRKVKKKDLVKVTLTRGGQKMEIRYHID
jgi:hypothetical protein